MTPVSLLPSGAEISPCRTWRYALERRWGDGAFAMFVMLNPSTADGLEDDATVRRCVGFARAWGFGGLLVGNLYAYRATDPRELAAARPGIDVVGPDCDVWLTTMANRSALVVAAWGAHRMARVREAEVRELLCPVQGHLFSLGSTSSGAPRHPLRLRGDTRPRGWP